MKKMFNLLVILFVLYFGFQQLFTLLNKEHTVTYNVGDARISEHFVNKGSETDGYFFSIGYGDYTYPFKLVNKLNRQKRVIDDVKIFEGDIYTCANISVRKNYNVSDIKCYKDDVLYFYSNIKGEDVKLDLAIAQSSYDINNFISNNESDIKDDIVYFPNNFIKKQTILLSVYKGAYLFGTKVSNNARLIKLFEKDQYNKPLETIVGKYYLVANYNDSHEYLSLKRINMVTGVFDDISLIDPISFDSFFQGSDGNNLYIIDRANKVQYEIEVKDKEENISGNITSGALVYTNEGWKKYNINDVISSNLMFERKSKELPGFEYDDILYFGDGNGIYLLFEKNGSYYDTYMILEEDAYRTKTYLFKCSNPSKVKYQGGYIYYTLDDELRLFKENIGNRTMLRYSELKYNENLNYYVY